MKPLASFHAAPTQHAGFLERACVPGTEGGTQSRSPERATPHQEVLRNQQVARSHVKAPQSSIRFLATVCMILRDLYSLVRERTTARRDPRPVSNSTALRGSEAKSLVREFLMEFGVRVSRPQFTFGCCARTTPWH